jgi:hypothetical protein
MKKPNADQRKTISEAQLILEINALFESGKTGKTDLYGLLRTKYKLGKDRYFKTFDEAIRQWAELKEKATADSIDANQKEVLKTSNLTKIQRILIAEEIAIGKPKRLGKEVILISPMERLKALDYLAKINSDYAPTKTEISGGISITSPEERRRRVEELMAKANVK